MFRWDKPIHVEKRVQTANGALTVQKGEATPRAIVFDPFNYRVEDVMNALCITMREVIETVEAQAKMTAIRGLIDAGGTEPNLEVPPRRRAQED